MRAVFFLSMSLAAWAQSSSTTYQKNVNGDRVAINTEDRTKAGNGTERVRSVDGHTVPLEQTSERVVRQDANGKVVERTTTRFDPNGRISSADRVVVEETRLAGGGKLVKETSSRSDVNGAFQEMERRTSETQISGQTSTTNVTIDRPNINGGLATAERRSIVTTGPVERQSSTETIEQPTGNGGFRAVRRIETATQTNGATSTENQSHYELGTTGRMTLTVQKVATTTKRPDGGEIVETKLYSQAVAGDVQGPNGRMRVKEQQILQRQPGPDGQMRETLSVAHPSMADPTKLDSLHQISERVCTGKCSETPVPVARTASAATAKGK